MRRKFYREKRKVIMYLCILLLFGLGLGYAVLNEKLNIGGTVHYESMTWDVGFSEASDGGGSISSAPAISQDKKTITINCDVGTSTASETCITNATIANNSTVAVALNTSPTITYDSTYISSIKAIWVSNSAEVKQGDTIGVNATKDLKITITTKELSEDLIPSDSLDIPISITMEWVEAENIIEVSFADKTAIFFGDSVAYGYSTNGNGFGYYINQEEQFLSYTNAAVNTATLNTTTQGTNNVINQINKNKNNEYDFVIIEGGYGDLRDEPPLGSLTDDYDESKFDTTTFAGAVEYTLYLATTYWEEARIGFIISYDTPNSNYGVRPDHDATKEYWDIVKAACNKWKVDYLDFFEGSTTYNGETKTYSELFDVTGNTYLASDNIHPTAEGYEFITQFIAEWMKKISIYERDFNSNNDDSTTVNGNTVVTSPSNLVFTGGYSIGSDGVTKETLGRAATVDYLLKVDGGETVGLSSSATNVSYALYEYNDVMSSSGGEKSTQWLSDDVTLNINTRYVRVAFKNGDGTSEFSTEQLALLPTYLEIKSEAPDNTTPDETTSLTTVSSFSDLVFVKDKTAPGAASVPTWGEQSVVGRASAVNYLVEVTGGETIGLSNSASNVSYAIAEFNSNQSAVNNGQTHNAWLNEDITLQSDTRYILVSFKNGDGSTSFTDEQLALLPTYIEFK